MSLLLFKDFDVDVWAFDNDGTLYQNSRKLESAVDALMSQYVADAYGLNSAEGYRKRIELLKKHNTQYSLIALKNEGVDEDRFIKNTYLAIDPQQYGIMPNTQLREALQCLKGEKIVLTNNPSEFAELIMRVLGIRDLFSHIYGMRELNFVQKPKREAFAALETLIGGGKKVIFFDDTTENIKIAKVLGCTTVLVGNQNAGEKISDFWIPSLI